jgi:hypothetical protein
MLGNTKDVLELEEAILKLERLRDGDGGVSDAICCNA